MPNDPQLFTIGEFSQISGLSVKALRFYDEKGLLKPAHVDAASDYRYYDAACVERARVIASSGAPTESCSPKPNVVGWKFNYPPGKFI